jgi:hypothetical protein
VEDGILVGPRMQISVNALSMTGGHRANSTGRRNTSIREVVHGTTEGMGGGSDRAAADALPGTTTRVASRASAGFLGRDRGGCQQ